MEDRPNILLIVIDSLRADHCSCYGYPVATTPSIDEMAREGLLFSQAISPGCATFPVHASIFTGRYPTEHGSGSAGFMDGDVFDTLAGLLRTGGYTTVAFSENPRALANGLDRGFDAVVPSWTVWDSFVQRAARRLFDSEPLRRLFGARRIRLRGEYPGGKIHETSRTIDGIISWVKNFSSQPGHGPFFLFCNFCDVHMPYQPPASLIPSTLRAPANRALALARYSGPTALMGLHERELLALGQLYDLEVGHVDKLLEALFSRLGDLGVLQDALLVITADHGDHLGDHGLFGHGLSLFDSLLRVPLIVHYPPRLKGGQVCSDQIQVIDIFPTLLRVANVVPSASNAAIMGEGLLGGDGGQRSEAAFSEAYTSTVLLKDLAKAFPDIDESHIPGHLRCVRTKDYKYIQSCGPGQEFYDLNADPGETINLAIQHLAEMNEMKRLLETWHDSLAPADVSETNELEYSTSDKVRDRLRALGYIE